MTYTEFNDDLDWNDLCQNLEHLGDLYIGLGFDDLARIYWDAWGFYYFDLEEIVPDVLDY